LIAGLALLAFGSGPVRGFAIVHCIGILTSMFSAVFFSRGIVNAWYGGKKKLKTLAIGQVWRPAAADGVAYPQVSHEADTDTDTMRATKAVAATPKSKGGRGGQKPVLRNRARDGAASRKPGSPR
jgi:preprotein translocase subunit SecD